MASTLSLQYLYHQFKNSCMPISTTVSRSAHTCAAATQYDGDGDEQYWKDSWDDAEDHGGWGYAPAWAQNK